MTTAGGAYADQVDVHEVPGDHDGMVLEPNVRVLAARLRQSIEAAETESVAATIGRQRIAEAAAG